MSTPRQTLPRLADWWRRPGVQRFWRYIAGSVIAFGVSQVTFLVCYGPRWTSPQVASVLAFVTGAPVNYVLNRRWAWQRRDRPSLLGEVVPYATIISVSIGASAYGTWAVDRWLASVALARWLEIVVVGATFALINGGLFLIKYVLFDRLFRGPRRPSGGRVRDAETVP